MPPFALMNLVKVSSHTFFIDAMLDTNYRQESPAMQDVIILLTNQPPCHSNTQGIPPWQVSEPLPSQFCFPAHNFNSFESCLFPVYHGILQVQLIRNSPCIRAEPFIPEHRFAVQMFKLRHRWYYSLQDTPSVLFVSSQEVGYEQLWNSAMHRQRYHCRYKLGHLSINYSKNAIEVILCPRKIHEEIYRNISPLPHKVLPTRVDVIKFVRFSSWTTLSSWIACGSSDGYTTDGISF